MRRSPADNALENRKFKSTNPSNTPRKPQVPSYQNYRVWNIDGSLRRQDLKIFLTPKLKLTAGSRLRVRSLATVLEKPRRSVATIFIDGSSEVLTGQKMNGVWSPLTTATRTSHSARTIQLLLIRISEASRRSTHGSVFMSIP